MGETARATTPYSTTGSAVSMSTATGEGPGATGPGGGGGGDYGTILDDGRGGAATDASAARQALLSSNPARHRNRKAPKDRRGLAFIVFAVLGVGMLFPWNCFLTAADTFKHQFPNANFEFTMASVYNVPSIIMLLLSVKYGSRFSISSRIYIALVLDLIMMVVVTIVPYLPLSEPVALALTLFCVFVTGVATAALFGSVLGLAAFFPDRYTTAVMSGNGVAGLAAVLLRIATKLALGGGTKGLETSSTIYFALAAGVILMCIIFYSLLMSLPVTRYYLRHTDEMRKARRARRAESHARGEDICEEDYHSDAALDEPPPPGVLASLERKYLENTTLDVPGGNHHQHPHHHHHGHHLVHKETLAEANTRIAAEYAAADIPDDEESHRALDAARDAARYVAASAAAEQDPLLGGGAGVEAATVEIHACGDPHPSIMAVFKKIWPLAIGVMMVFMVTLSVFPGVSYLVPSHSKTMPQDWFWLTQVSLFMIGDFTGRTLPRWVVIFNKRTLAIPIAIRCGFLVVFYLAVKPGIFVSDWIAYAVMLTFALSNGYLGTLAMMFGPLDVEQYEKELAGTMMSFFLNVGIFVGAQLALLFLFLLTGRGPLG